MKLRFLLVPLAAATVLSGCVTTQGAHTYVDGRCITCINNPMTGEAVNYDPQAQQPITANSQTSDRNAGGEDGCREPRNKYDQTRHFRDDRWCDDITLPGGGILSNQTSFDVTLDVDVDMAYIRAKRLLKFTDPDDRAASDGYLNDNTRWDGIEGKYYAVYGFYGGPTQYMLWYAKYNLEVEKVSATQSRVRVSYVTYGKDNKAAEFKSSLISAMKGA
jgi:hypothetical protein